MHISVVGKDLSAVPCATRIRKVFWLIAGPCFAQKKIVCFNACFSDSAAGLAAGFASAHRRRRTLEATANDDIP